jgi:hypothetical protein
MHKNDARDRKADATQYRLSCETKKNIRPAYKVWIAKVGTTLITIGATLQNMSQI